MGSPPSPAKVIVAISTGGERVGLSTQPLQGNGSHVYWRRTSWAGVRELDEVSMVLQVASLHFWIWNIKSRRLMFFAARSLLHSTESMMGRGTYSVSLFSLVKTKW